MLANACGPCIGQWHRDDISEGDVNSIISSFNRNFAKRNDGNPQTNSFISSPEIVVAYALAGQPELQPADRQTHRRGRQLSTSSQPPAPKRRTFLKRGFIFKADGYLGAAGGPLVDRGQGGGRIQSACKS